MLEVHHFIIFPDHKPITYAFQQKRDKCSPRQFNHLNLIAQFTTDKRHISGKVNVFADALSRVKFVTAPPSHDALAASQDMDNELQTLLASNTALRLEEQQTPGTTVSIYCDISAVKSVPVRPRSVTPRHQSNSEVGGTTFHVARHTEALPHLGTGLPSLPTLQSFPPHCYSP
jgi:hypothetical protein